MKKTVLLILLTLNISLNSCKQTGKPTYKDATADIEDRITDLLERMTVAEKARQLDMYTSAEITADNILDIEKIDSVVGINGIGSLHDLYPVSAKLANDIQKYMVERTRLGIPVLMIEEALHGYQGSKGTCFPAPIGLATLWDTALMHKVGRVIGTEARAHGVHFVLSPVLGLAREPRWGRVEETYGEDPYLAAQTGLAIIKGMQGNSLRDQNAVISEPKHFAIHSVPESGTNTAPVHVGEREARSTFLYVFQTAIERGGALGIMAAYHDWDGVPCVSNSFLLKKILRDEWGFQGMVLSDLGAIRMLNTNHFTAETPKDAVVAALKAGVDMQFMDFPHEVFQQSIIEAIKDGSLKIDELDRAARCVLSLKFKLGLFENPYTDISLVTKYHHSKEHQALALEAGRKSICLLKNENHLLPFSKDIKSIAVVGPLADVQSLGDYSPKDVSAITVLEGIRKKFGSNVKINYAAGLLPIEALTVVDSSFLHTRGKKHNGLLAEYFNNSNFEGVPGLIRIETNMAPYYQNTGPGYGIRDAHFTVRWTGTITAPASGFYEIGIITDDKGRLFLNNKLIIDNWEPYQINVMITKKVHLFAGQAVPIKMELGQEVDYAGIRLKWRLTQPDPGSLNSVNEKVLNSVQKSDITILVLGETDDVVGEGKDKSDLDLDAAQEKLAELVYASGKPTATVLLNGRPLSIDWLAENASAILEAWFPGEFGGQAVADVLFGDYNPSGKLPISFPKSIGQLPVFYNYKPSARKGYVDGDNEPLFSFGYGLSYTIFEYSNLKIEPADIPADGISMVSVDIKNAGDREGAEVVQLYINDKFSSVTTPKIALKGFSRVELKPGETKTVSMKLTPEELSLWNIEMKNVVEPGLFDIMVGSSCKDIRLRGELNVK
ncbi:MAG: glycoside hydrolase family 3 N-terminal domain-containing protein [Ignavibacteriaceae bacterium]